MEEFNQIADEKKLRAHNLHKFDSKRLFLSVAILSVIAVTITIGESLNNKNRPVYILAGSPEAKALAARQIASTDGYLFNSVDDVKMGYQILDRINSSRRGPASVTGSQASLKDRLQFEELSGKYKLESADNNFEIKFVGTNDVTDRPLVLKDRAEFLTTFRPVFRVNYSRFELLTKSNINELFVLIDKQGKVVGQAEFEFDDQGRFTTLKVQQN